MATPSFVNSGTRGSQSFGTSVSPGLPASRVVGNLLVMVWYHGASGITPNTPSGWTLLDSSPTDSVDMFIWWRIVDGTETTPTITWTGSTSAHAYILQYTGNLGNSGWLGTESKNSSASTPSTNMNHPGITTTANNSLVVMIAGNTAVTFTAGQAPTGYTAEFDNANDEVADVAEVTKGSSSPAVAQTLASGNWTVFEVEIRSALPNNPRTFLSHPMVG